MKGRPKNTPSRFWSKVDVRGPDECWLWTAGLRNGYGHHCIDRVDISAHRYAWELANGCKAPSSRRLQILHSCNNKACCNPNHLSLGTSAKNTRDAYADGLARSGERHPKAKLTVQQVAAIRSDRRRQVDIAAEYKVTQQVISRIKSGQIWRHC